MDVTVMDVEEVAAEEGSWPVSALDGKECMRHLSKLDQLFVGLETSEVSLHGASMSILGPVRPGGVPIFEVLRHRLSDRRSAHPMVFSRLAQDQYGRSVWVETERTDLDHHLEFHRLPKPGDFDVLREFTAHQTTRPLDRRRPLWRVIVAEGLGRTGRTALITICHHAAQDWRGLSQWLSTMFDPIDCAREGGAQGHGGDGFDLAAERKPQSVFDPMAQRLRTSIRGLQSVGKLVGRRRLRPPPPPFCAPRTLLNSRISSHRVWDCVHFELARLDRLRRPVGATINDLVMAICAGALRRYLAEKGQLPVQSLVALVPYADPQRQNISLGGNHVSTMLVSLATTIDDPHQRLLAIRRNAETAKAVQQALGGQTLSDAIRWMPPGLAAKSLRAGVLLPEIFGTRPSSNVTITNLPGPKVPVSLGGARVEAQIGLPAIYDGLGPTVGVYSYNGWLSLTVVACPRAVPDLSRLMTMMEHSLCDLEGRAMVNRRRWPSDLSQPMAGETEKPNDERSDVP